MDEERHRDVTSPEPELEATSDHGQDLVQVQAELAVSEELRVPPTSADTGELERLRQELEEQRHLAEDYLDQARRARAELVNYRRRVQQEMDELRTHAHAHLIMKLLPVLDDFHLASASIPEEERQNPWIQGLLLIERKLWNVLETEGVRGIDAVGMPFNPAEHEAIALDAGEGEEQVVVEEVRRGYMLGGRVLRPSLVRVGRRTRQGQETEGEQQRER